MTGDPVLSETPTPQGKDELQPHAATIAAPPHLGPGSTVEPAEPEETFQVAVRLEPFGPPTTVLVTNRMKMGAVKEAAMKNLQLAPSSDGEFILVRNGWKLDDEETVSEVGLYELDFMSIGKPGDVYLADPALWGDLYGARDKRI